jgi:hypothetical protein
MHRTLSHEDSEEIGKGINAILNKRLKRYDNGRSGRVNLLLGQIQCYRVRSSAIGSDLDLLHGARLRVHWAAAPAGWATQAVRAVRSAGPRRGFGPNADFK